MLVRVVAPHFVAGLVLDHVGTVVRAAPILGWAMRKPWCELRSYFLRRGWSYERV